MLCFCLFRAFAPTVFFTSNFKKDEKSLAPLEIFSSPGYVGLAPALFRMYPFFTLITYSVPHSLAKLFWANFVRFGRNSAKLRRNLGKIEGKFGQKWLDLGKIKILHLNTFDQNTKSTLNTLDLLRLCIYSNQNLIFLHNLWNQCRRQSIWSRGAKS